MPQPQPPRRAERWIVAIAVALIVLARSGVFLIWGQSAFDADQAVFGLMATHLSEGRAFPVFMYGQNYMLAVDAWTAAPLFRLFGPSIFLLKLPLVAWNVLVALLLLRILERDVGLRPALAGVATSWFALPAVGTSALLVAPAVGNVAPFLYVTLIWLLRRRPIWCGVALGVGFLQREFTIYGIVALLVIEVGVRSAGRGARGAEGGGRGAESGGRESSVSRRAELTSLVGRFAVIFATAAAIWVIAQWLKGFGSAVGPGTSWRDLPAPPNDLTEIANRVCVDPRTLAAGLWRIATIHWPELFGAAVYPVSSFGIQSRVHQGLAGSGWLLAIIMTWAAGRIVMRVAATRRWPAAFDAPAYLVLAGALSVLGYVGARCGAVDPHLMRYELLSLAGAVGLSAWYLRVESARRLARTWIALVLVWTALVAVPHVELWRAYLTHPFVPAKQQLIWRLQAAGIEYATADYWIAYYVTFVTDEHIIVDSEDIDRVFEYDRLVAQHRAESIRILRQPCDRGTVLIPGVYACPPR
ncbi:MAG TPA: hypothetical protein VFX12_13030 [Vicinamibacterales bacterium]|nr:hypothetical protein [Vicinamibacterales bacterium]